VDRSVRPLPGFPAAEGTAADTLGRLTDPSRCRSGGSQVGQVIRRMTEGPRFADVGQASMHGPAHGALDGGADRGAHLL
jgi:hypothetical protein